MRIASYNICSCQGMDGLCRPERTIETLGRLGFDVCGVQEVSIGRSDCGPKPGYVFPEEAASALGCEARFGLSEQLKSGGQYGLSVLSRLPLEGVEVLHYAAVPAGQEPRTALIARIGGARPFTFACTHLPYHGEFEGDAEARLACVRELERHLDERWDGPAIVVGDFNDPPCSPTIQHLREGWLLANEGALTSPTLIKPHPPTGFPHIDYIICRPQAAFRVRSFQIVQERLASDHFPIVAEVDFA